MKVSFIIVAYNAEKYLENSLNSLLLQDYDLKKIEVILVDSVSSDHTKSVMMDFQKKHLDKFYNILVLDNIHKTLPYGWNVALSKASGDAIVRVDAHSKFPENFVSNNVKEIENGENIVGGHRISITDSKSKWQKMLLIAEESLFGSGIAKYRRQNKREYVNTLAHAMYRKKVFDEVGPYNVNLSRTEDNEMHYRMRKAGYKFLLSPDVISYHCARNTLNGMIKQKYGNGKWIGITMYYCPKCFSLYHFVPLIFVLGIIFSVIMFLFNIPVFLYALASSYLLFNILNLMGIIFHNGFHLEYFLLPFIFLLLHLVYGLGTIIGLIVGPFNKIKFKRNSKKEENVFEYKNSMLRDLQLKSLEIFSVLLKVCQENNLKIFFCGGCLIGTIRNKGFIPWDDDIDVFMPRDDYEKLKLIWHNYSSKAHYELVIPSKENYVRNLFMTFNDNKTTFIKTHQKDLDMNHGIRIDILPLDGCPKSLFKRRMQKMWALLYSIYCAQMIPVNHGRMVSFLGRIMLWLVPFKSLRWKFVSFAEKKMTKYKISDCDYITELCSGPKYMQNEYKKEWFDKIIYKEFEDEEMPIPNGYDEYLKMAFGDYLTLPPKEKQIPEHNVILCDLNKSYLKYKGKYYCTK